MPKRYHEMSRRERIEDSDRVAVMELEKELRKRIKQKYAVEIEKDDLVDVVKKWLKKEWWLTKEKR